MRICCILVCFQIDFFLRFRLISQFALCPLCYLFSRGIAHLCNHAESVVDSCESLKQDGITLIASEDKQDDVIVLDPVDDSICNLQCAVGWYEAEYGNKAPFLCAPQTSNTTSREGIPTYPINCTSAYIVPTCCVQFSFFRCIGLSKVWFENIWLWHVM